VDSNRRTIWIADAHRDDGKRFVVRADEKLTAFWNWNQRSCDHQDVTVIRHDKKIDLWVTPVEARMRA
jgi:hypothetical protein